MVFILIKTSVRDNTSTVLNMNADKSQLLLYLDDIIQNTTESNDLIRYTKENGCIYEYSKKMGYIWSSRELNSVYSIIEYQKPE